MSTARKENESVEDYKARRKQENVKKPLTYFHVSKTWTTDEEGNFKWNIGVTYRKEK